MCFIIYELNKGLGGAGVSRACRNDHGSCDNLSSRLTYNQWILACNQVSPRNNRTPATNICVVCLNKLAESYQGHM